MSSTVPSPREFTAAPLSRDEARSLTDEVKNDAERLWRKLVELYEGKAHTTLGYSSWGAYFKAEFGGSATRGEQLLRAGRVLEALENTNGIPAPRTERIVRELAPLKSNPETLKEVWAEVLEMHPEPTAADVREVVRQKVVPVSGKAAINANAEKRRVNAGLAGIDGYVRGLKHLDVARILSVATVEEIAEWNGLIGSVSYALDEFRKSLKGAK